MGVDVSIVAPVLGPSLRLLTVSYSRKVLHMVYCHLMLYFILQYTSIAKP